MTENELLQIVLVKAGDAAKADNGQLTWQLISSYVHLKQMHLQFAKLERAERADIAAAERKALQGSAKKLEARSDGSDKTFPRRLDFKK